MLNTQGEGTLGVLAGMECDCPVSPSLILILQSGEAVKELYNQLSEKLELRKPSPAEVTETPSMELPLPTVPTPASR